MTAVMFLRVGDRPPINLEITLRVAEGRERVLSLGAFNLLLCCRITLDYKI